jgi:CPA2 family monovalent cation:H+ antiporter-2
MLVWALKHPFKTALTVAIALAQIGEFSFILGGLGVNLGLLPYEGYNLILAGAIISIVLNPFVFGLVAPLDRKSS